MKKHSRILLIILSVIFALTPLASCNESITNETMPETTEKSEIPPNNGEWDEILISADGYYIVKKTIDTYNNYSISIGVVDADGKWIHELSQNNIFVQAYNEYPDYNFRKNNFYYLGEGVFILTIGAYIHNPNKTIKLGNGTPSMGIGGYECYFFNVIKNKQKVFEATDLSNYYNGYMLMYNSFRYNDNFYSVDTEGNINKLPCIHSSWISYSGHPIYSEGLFFAEDKFFDIFGSVAIDLTKYDLCGEGTPPYFINGQCTIQFKNSGGSVYEAIIDRNGNFVGQPQKIN